MIWSWKYAEATLALEEQILKKKVVLTEEVSADRKEHYLKKFLIKVKISSNSQNV